MKIHCYPPKSRTRPIQSVHDGIEDVEISGSDGDRLLALSERVRSLRQAAPDVRDNDDDWGNEIVKVVIEIDQDRRVSWA